jgi:1,4-alpha-glucan branching enzyme
MEEGIYEEIFNTDKDIYSGWGQYNGLPVKSEPGSFEGLPAHITIKLACLGACIFKFKPAPKKRASKKSK